MNALDTATKIVFDNTNPNWSPNADYNELFLHSISNYCVIVLRMRGHLFLNDVHDQLGMRRTRDGAKYGWFREEGSKTPNFEIEQIGVDNSYVIKLDTDGIIWDRI